MTNLIGPQAGGQVTTRPTRSNAYGVPRTWHAPCSSPLATDGTVTDADMFNDWLAQFRTLYDAAGIVEDNGDDMLLRAVRSYGVRFGTDTGSVNALVATFSPPVVALTAGMLLLVQVGHNITGATTFKPDGMSVTPLRHGDNSALVAGDLKAGEIPLCVYDAVNGVFQVVSVLPASGGSAAPSPGIAAACGSGGSSTLPAGAVAQITGLTVVETSTLVTSTWDGANLTIGTGEDGRWHLYAAGSTGQSGPASYLYISIHQFRAGVAIAIICTGYSNPPYGERWCETSGIIDLQVGDVIRLIAGIGPPGISGLPLLGTPLTPYDEVERNFAAFRIKP